MPEKSLADFDLTKPPELEEKPREEEKPEEENKTVDQALFAFPGAPDKGRIEEWKQKWGEVLCSGFTSSELFVFRPITRAEWVNLQAILAKSETPITQYDVEDKLAKTCVLWASTPGLESLEKKAGSLTTLYEQIMQASNFMNPAMAASFVSRL